MIPHSRSCQEDNPGWYILIDVVLAGDMLTAFQTGYGKLSDVACSDQHVAVTSNLGVKMYDIDGFE